MSRSKKEQHALHQDNLFDFFSKRVDDAKAERGVELDTWTTTYLAHLLVRVGRTRDLFRDDSPDTLAEIHLAARSADRREAARLYRYLGDRALSIAGYFKESLRRGAVGPAYYEAMGESAYYQVATMGLSGAAVARSADPWTGVFLELARRMGDCIGLFQDISERDRAEGTQDVVRLYELWLESRSPHAARRLSELGVLAVAPEEEAS
ncbi:MAG: hypothetical protein H6740_25290 [Alphaproteobacteria bacterium]|nr:hypothetical protein [Alphaproteobacteria bacterium]